LKNNQDKNKTKSLFFSKRLN